MNFCENPTEVSVSSSAFSNRMPVGRQSTGSIPSRTRTAFSLGFGLRTQETEAAARTPQPSWHRAAQALS